MSKGSKRRPCFVSDEQLAENWDAAFGKPDGAPVVTSITKDELFPMVLTREKLADLIAHHNVSCVILSPEDRERLFPPQPLPTNDGQTYCPPGHFFVCGVEIQAQPHIPPGHIHYIVSTPYQETFVQTERRLQHNGS